jgi:hypothetical protein
MTINKFVFLLLLTPLMACTRSMMAAQRRTADAVCGCATLDCATQAIRDGVEARKQLRERKLTAAEMESAQADQHRTQECLTRLAMAMRR